MSFPPQKCSSDGSDQTSSSDEEKAGVQEQDQLTNHLTGWRRWALTTALSLVIFLTTLEVSIVATSLVAISDQLNAFDKASWIVTAYLLTFTAFLIIIAKLSDILGRKPCIIAGFTLFIIFSGGCGASQTMIQLITLRAFQGLSAAGAYAVSLTSFFELVPSSKMAFNTTLVTLIYVLSQVCGPLLGGAINRSSGAGNENNWRWVFLLNVPAGIVTLVLLLLAMPEDYPFHNLPASAYRPLTIRQKFSKQCLRKVDFPGFVFLLFATALLISALEEASNGAAWGSSFVIAGLSISAIFWIAFFGWSKWIQYSGGPRESVFPWRFLQSRVILGLLGLATLTGAPFTIALIDLPLRFQSVNHLSPLDAAIKSMPLIALCPIGATVASVLMTKAKIPPMYLTLGGSIIQIIGFALLSTAPSTADIWNSFYAYEAIAGFGIGVNFLVTSVVTPLVAEPRDKAVATSDISQFRLLGGAIGLAVVTTILINYVRYQLGAYLSSDQIEALLQTTQSFSGAPPQLADRIVSSFAAGYNIQMRVVIGFAAAQVPMSCLLWGLKEVLIS